MKKLLVLGLLTGVACAEEPLLQIGKWLPERVASIRVSADGQNLLVMPHYYDDQERNLELYRVADGRRVAELKPKVQHLSAAFAPDGKHVVAVAEEMVTPAEYTSRAYVWDLQGQPVGQPLALSGDLADQPTPPAADTVVVTNWENKEKGDANGGTRWAEGQVQLWHWPTGKLRTVGNVRARVESGSVSPDGRYVATLGGDTMSGLWDTRTAKLVYRNYNDSIRFSSIPGVIYTNKQILAVPSLTRLGSVLGQVHRESSGKTLYSLAKVPQVLDGRTLRPLRKAKFAAAKGFDFESARTAGRLTGDRLLLWDPTHHASAILSP